MISQPGWSTQVLVNCLNQPKSPWSKFWPKKTPMWGFCNNTLRSCPKKHVRPQNDVFYKTKRGFVLVLGVFRRRGIPGKHRVETHGVFPSGLTITPIGPLEGEKRFKKPSTFRNSRWLVPRKKTHRVFKALRKNMFFCKSCCFFFRFFCRDLESIASNCWRFQCSLSSLAVGMEGISWKANRICAKKRGPCLMMGFSHLPVTYPWKRHQQFGTDFPSDHTDQHKRLFSYVHCTLGTFPYERRLFWATRRVEVLLISNVPKIWLPSSLV